MDILNLSENTDTIILAVIIILAALIPYIYSIVKKEKKIRKLYRHAVDEGTDKPLLQHPIFDLAACIGCGVCTEVCPEGQVLGIINGKVAIVNGAHCVGHGECARHCPVGAIKIGLGDISTREDIPTLSGDYETTVPGIYIAGELGGLALIRNAIEQGVEVVDAIARKAAETNQKENILIIGAGPAGIAAALQCVKKKLNYRIIDQEYPGGTILNYPRRKLTLVQKVHLPLYGDMVKQTYSKEDLLELWDELIKKYKIKIETMQKLENITPLDNGFSVKTNKTEFEADQIILALGRRGIPRKLGVPGEERTKVMYKLIDTSSYTNNNLLVVGGGDSAIEAAIGLAHQTGNQVTISYRKENFFRLKKRNNNAIQDAIKLKEVQVLFSSNVKEILDDKVILIQDGKEIELENDYTFIFAGGVLPFKLLESIGISFGKVIESQL